MDRMSQDRNQQLTVCQGIRERKQVISGQNVTGQESTTYSLSRDQRKETGDQWTECHGQELTTYPLSRDRRKKTGDQWTECHNRNQQLTHYQGIRERRQVINGECHRTAINDLPSVDGQISIN